MDDDNRTMYELVRNALDVANASNLSGVVHSFSRDVRRVRALLEAGGYHSTDMVNRHPVCVLYAQAISNITQQEMGLTYSRAYTWCSAVKDRGQHADPTTYDTLPGFQTNGAK